MTIAAGMLCDVGIVFGADTDESIGEMRRRVHKIPTLLKPPAMITGSCENGHLMDTAIERIFDKLKEGKAKTIASIASLLRGTMLGLYQSEFALYPDKTSTYMKLLVAVRAETEKKVAGWSIDCSAVRRMKPVEILGRGELVQSVVDHLYRPQMEIDKAVLAMVQVVSVAKERVQYVGGENYVHALRDDGGFHGENFRFSPEKENLYEFFCEMGRDLLLATGIEGMTSKEYEAIATKFITDLKWKRAQIFKP